MDNINPSLAAPIPYEATPYGYYRKIGSAFTANGVKWQGAVIASPEAIYLLKVARVSAGVAGAAAAGGLVGGLIAGAIAAATRKPDDNRTCTYFQLPEQVRSHPDWPIKKRKKDVDVIVIARDSAPPLTHPRFTNLIKLTVKGITYVIEYTLFAGGKTKRFLAAAGWAMGW
jgi:hypothetical protein